MTREIALHHLKHGLISEEYPLTKADKQEILIVLEQEPNCSEITTSSTIKNDLGVDCISREDALMCLTGMFENREYEPSELIKIFARRIKTLPSVTPQQKMGHWIEHPHEAGANWEYSRYECSECHEWAEDDSNFCPDCGCRMIEPQESEDKE